jgi:uncharacterized protein YydD (DUF2326 family)
VKENADDNRKDSERIMEFFEGYKVTVSNLIMNQMNHILKFVRIDNEELRNTLKHGLSRLENELIKWNKLNEKNDKKIEGMVAVKKMTIKELSTINDNN